MVIISAPALVFSLGCRANRSTWTVEGTRPHTTGSPHVCRQYFFIPPSGVGLSVEQKRLQGWLAASSGVRAALTVPLPLTAGRGSCGEVRAHSNSPNRHHYAQSPHLAATARWHWD